MVYNTFQHYCNKKTIIFLLTWNHTIIQCNRNVQDLLLISEGRREKMAVIQP